MLTKLWLVQDIFQEDSTPSPYTPFLPSFSVSASLSHLPERSVITHISTLTQYLSSQDRNIFLKWFCFLISQKDKSMAIWPSCKWVSLLIHVADLMYFKKGFQALALHLGNYGFNFLCAKKIKNCCQNTFFSILLFLSCLQKEISSHILCLYIMLKKIFLCLLQN